jgi:hypothetical protein
MQRWLRQQPRDRLPRHCGLLPQRGTLHNVFSLSNAVHHAVGCGEKLCVLLLDVASACDNVDHACMVATLNELGLPQHLVRAVHGMYSGLQYRLCCKEAGLSEPLKVGVGVKQGWPVSPLLFCLYVQPVSRGLVGETEPAVHSLNGNSLLDWAHALVVVLLACTAEGLQRLTGAAARAFLRRRLDSGLAKCVMLCANVLALAVPAGLCYVITLTR